MTDETLPVVRNVVLADQGYYNALAMIEVGLEAARARLATLRLLEDEFRAHKREQGHAAQALKKPFAVIDPDKIALQLTEDDVRHLIIRQEGRIKAGEAALKDFQDPHSYGYALVSASDAHRLSKLDSLTTQSKFTYAIIGEDEDRQAQMKVNGTVLFTMQGYSNDQMVKTGLDKLTANIVRASREQPSGGDDE